MEIFGQAFAFTPSKLISTGGILIVAMSVFLSFIFYREIGGKLFLPIVFILLSLFFVVRDERKEFLAEVNRAIEKGDLKLLYVLASVYEFEGRYSELINTYIRIINAFPHDDTAYTRLAITLAHFGYFDLAIPILERAIEINPENPETKKILETMKHVYEMRKKENEKKENGGENSK